MRQGSNATERCTASSGQRNSKWQEACHTVDLTTVLLKEDGIASVIQVIPFGLHRTDKGDFILDEASADEIVNDFNTRSNDMVIDYEHQTLSGGEAPAAGWIKKLTNKAKDGIWAVVEWTERAKEYLKNREYRYLSPVFLKRLSDNKVIRLINAGLTNQPAIDGMVPIVNRQSVIPTCSESFLNKDAGQAGMTSNRKEVSMDKVLEMLGLKADATEDEAIASVSALKVEKSQILTTLGLNADATSSEVTGTIMALKQAHTQHEDLSKKVSELEAKLKKKDADELITQAMKQGKVTPAQKDWAEKYATEDPDGFKVFIAKAPQVIKTGEIAGSERAGDGFSIDETQVVVNKLLGVSEETFKKYSS